MPCVFSRHISYKFCTVHHNNCSFSAINNHHELFLQVLYTRCLLRNGNSQKVEQAFQIAGSYGVGAPESAVEPYSGTNSVCRILTGGEKYKKQYNHPAHYSAHETLILK